MRLIAVRAFPWLVLGLQAFGVDDLRNGAVAHNQVRVRFSSHFLRVSSRTEQTVGK